MKSINTEDGIFWKKLVHTVFPHIRPVLYDAIQKTRILVINVFEYCPRVYIEGGYYFFTRPSTAGIIRVRVLFEVGPYMRKYGNYNKQGVEGVKNVRHQ